MKNFGTRQNVCPTPENKQKSIAHNDKSISYSDLKYKYANC
jgi:hypothetical protein